MQYERTIKRLDRLFHSTDRAALDLLHLVNPISEITENISKLYGSPSFLKIIDSIENIASIVQSIPFSNLEEIFNIYNQTMISIQQLQEIAIPISDQFLNQLSTVVDEASPYLPEQMQEECAEIISLPSEDDRKPFLTADRALTLLDLLLTLLTIVISLIPNSQAEEQTKQMERIAAAQEEKLHLEYQQSENLENIADSLKYLIVELSEKIETQEQQIEALRNQIEDIHNTGNLPDQINDTDGLQQDTDTQDKNCPS